MRPFWQVFSSIILLQLALIPLGILSCEKQQELEDSEEVNIAIPFSVQANPDATDELSVYNWSKFPPPVYDWENGGWYAEDLYIDVAFDPEGVKVVKDQIKFRVAPSYPKPPANAGSPHNFRSEIHTMPWEIRHPIGTEQWIGWRYTFGEDYVIDPTSPITIFQNHPGIRGESPQIELEIAALNDPRPATGGEIQIINAANGERIVTTVKPKAGETLDIVVHVVYGEGEDGLLQIWLDNENFYSKQVSTVYSAYPFGGNNKWGVYHHTFNNSPDDVEASIAAGSGIVELFMHTLKIITRTAESPNYLKDDFETVRPDN